MSKKTVNDLSSSDLQGKRVLVRADFNVPVDDQGKITDDTRIRAALPTIQNLTSKGAKVILCSHFGRPKGVDNKLRLTPVAKRLSEVLGQSVVKCDDCIGDEVAAKVSAMNNGDVILLENVRFYPEEEKNDPEFAKKLASIADLYVNDAFGTAHRAHASTEGVTHYLKPSVAGLLVEKELQYLQNAIENPQRPLAAIVGGSKVSSKIGVIDTLLEPFTYQFVVNGMMAAVLAGALCGLLGVFITLRGMSYIGHGLSHAVFGGYAAAPLLGVPILLGAGAWGLGSALLINAVARSRRIGADAAIGVVTTASFALGVALLTRFGTKGPAFDALLFGSINGVGRDELLLLLGALLFAVTTFTVLYRAFLFTTFDPDVADVSGINVKRMDALLMLVLSVSILATLTIIGVTLVAATLVIPAVVVRMLTDSFSRMLWSSTLLGAAAGAVGMYLSYHLAIPSGTTIVLVNAAVFVVVLLATGKRGARRAAGRRGARRGRRRWRRSRRAGGCWGAGAPRWSGSPGETAQRRVRSQARGGGP